MSREPRHRTDIDDPALDSVADHQLRRVLHQEEGRARVHREHAVEQLGRGVQHIAAVGQPGGVDEDVDAAEPLVGGGNDAPHILDVAEVGGYHFDRNVGFGGDGFRHRLTFFQPTTNDHDPRSACFGESSRDRRAQSLRATCDNSNFAADAVHFVTSYPTSAITRISSTWPFLAISSGGLTFGSCSASTTNQPS